MAAGCAAPEPKLPASQNAIVISLDTLRADHLSCYGYPRKTSPRLDRLAREGILFERAYSQAPWTRPSVATLFTGAGLWLFNNHVSRDMRYRDGFMVGVRFWTVLAL